MCAYMQKKKKIPEEHQERLRRQPHLAPEFDRIYGPGECTV